MKTQCFKNISAVRKRLHLRTHRHSQFKPFCLSTRIGPQPTLRVCGNICDVNSDVWRALGGFDFPLLEPPHGPLRSSLILPPLLRPSEGLWITGRVLEGMGCCVFLGFLVSLEESLQQKNNLKVKSRWTCLLLYSSNKKKQTFLLYMSK